MCFFKTIIVEVFLFLVFTFLSAFPKRNFISHIQVPKTSAGALERKLERIIG